MEISYHGGREGGEQGEACDWSYASENLTYQQCIKWIELCNKKAKYYVCCMQPGIREMNLYRLEYWKIS